MKKRKKKNSSDILRKIFLRCMLPIAWLATRIFRFSYKRKNLPSGPFLAVCNHQTLWDAIFVSLILNRHAYFVCTDDILRNGVRAWFLRKLFAPIPFDKGSNNAAAVREILRRLKKGASVVLFPEGELSPDGKTGDIPTATAKLISVSKVPLVTVRLKGGFFVRPQWSRKMRYGKVSGEIVEIYSKQQLSEMNEKDIMGILKRDLAQNDYEQQQKMPRIYRGRSLAESLDVFLFMCPLCRTMRTLHTRGDRIFCDCKMSARYDRYGFLSGDALTFQTVEEWAIWQRDEFISKVSAAKDNEILLRDMVEVCEIIGREEKKIGQKEMRATKTDLFLGEAHAKFSEIKAIAVRGNSRTLMLTFYGHYLRISGKNFCGQPYLYLYRYLRDEADVKKEETSQLGNI